MECISPEARVRVERTFAALKLRGVEPTYVKGRTEALTTVLGMVPKGSAVAHGTSTTLIEIGLVDRMKAPDSGCRYLNSEWTAENDAANICR